MTEAAIKTGHCFFLQEDGSLWLAESYIDKHGKVVTINTVIDRVILDDDAE